MLQDTEKFPLIIATDVVIGETSMYADYIFPDLTYLERWGNPIGTSPVVLTKISKFRQPVAAPLTEIVEVEGEEMPLSMEALVIAVAKRLGLSGFGKDAFGPGLPLDRPEDWYLKLIANLAAGDKPGDEAPMASDEEMELFRKARRHLPKAVFDEERWRRAVGDEVLWRRVVYLLNRGGRFEAAGKEYKDALPTTPGATSLTSMWSPSVRVSTPLPASGSPACLSTSGRCTLTVPRCASRRSTPLSSSPTRKSSAASPAPPPIMWPAGHPPREPGLSECPGRQTPGPCGR